MRDPARGFHIVAREINEFPVREWNRPEPVNMPAWDLEDLWAEIEHRLYCESEVDKIARGGD